MSPVYVYMREIGVGESILDLRAGDKISMISAADRLNELEARVADLEEQLAAARRALEPDPEPEPDHCFPFDLSGWRPKDLL